MRQIKPALVVGAPSGIAIKTRLHLSEIDETTLRALADLQGSLSGKDLRQALAGKPRQERKLALTPESSSRWAGTWTGDNDAQVALSTMAQRAHLDSVRAAIVTIESRLAVKAGKKAKVKVGSKTVTVCGYTSQEERWAKQQRSQHLRAVLADLEADIAVGKLHIVRGGRHLFKLVHNLEAAGLTKERWNELYWAARHKISANGSHDELYGNLTIRVDPDGVCSILLPSSLLYLANSKDKKHYVLEVRVKFSYRAADWKAQLSSGAISYEIFLDAAKRRWYLTAAWKLKTAGEIRSTTLMAADRAIGIDLNSDHLACWLADASGNPVSRPINIPLVLKGSSDRRDGHLRWAISQLLAFCKANQASRIYIENLNFADGKSRESFGHRKRFRHLISNFPTSKFKARLQTMAHRADIELVAIDPANTSKLSKPWIKPTSTKAQTTSDHQAAALAISRRGLSLSLSRRKGVTRRDQRIPDGELPSRQRNNGISLRAKLGDQRRPGQGTACSPNPSPPRPILAYLRPLKTVGSGPLISDCQ
jgi:IS605 OrfB family transposase